MLQGYSQEEEASLAYATQQSFAAFGSHQFAAELWHLFWKIRGLGDVHVVS